MKVDVFDLEGKPMGKIDLPEVFKEPLRGDLILRAVLATQSKKRQAYGVNVLAGKRTSAHYHGRRRLRPDVVMMNREMARMPRLHSRTTPHLLFQARFAPHVRKGRVAHPPKVEKIWVQKINQKERRKATMSAIAATAKKELVLRRGHKVKNIKELPIIVEDKIQGLKKTKEVVKFFKKIGLEKELERIKKKKIRAGKGKRRGFKYRKKKGPLFIITKDGGIAEAIKNIPGANCCRVENLSAEILSPGGVPGRLVIFTKSALEKLGE